MFNHLPTPSFNGFRAINDHVEERNKLEDYINGKSKEPPPDPGLTHCDAACLFAKWLHHPECKGLNDIDLHHQICDTCEVFHAAASQAALLMNMGKEDQAKEAIQDDGIYAKASAKFQRKLKLLHFQLDAVAV